MLDLKNEREAEAAEPAADVHIIEVLPCACSDEQAQGPRTILECLRTRRPGRDPRVTLWALIASEVIGTSLIVAVFGAGTGWRLNYVCGLVPLVASMLIFTCINLRLRVDEILRDRLFLAVTAVLVLSASYLIILASVVETDAMPLRSRLRFLLIFTVICYVKCFGFLWAGLDASILEASFPRLAWIAVEHAARLMDAATDAGVVASAYHVIEAERCWRCTPMLVMFVFALASSCVTFSVGMAFIFLPYAQSRAVYPWLVSTSFVSQICILTVTAVLGLHTSKSINGLDQHLFYAFSAAFCLTSFVSNWLGVRRLLRMIRGANRVVSAALSLGGSARKSTAAPDIAIAAGASDSLIAAGNDLDVDPLPVRRGALAAF